MSPTAMLTLMFAAIAMFSWSASRRWKLLQIGRPASRLDHLDARLKGTWRYAFRQEKMDYYNPAGIAHKLIFFGFIVLRFLLGGVRLLSFARIPGLIVHFRQVVRIRHGLGNIFFGGAFGFLRLPKLARFIRRLLPLHTRRLQDRGRDGIELAH